MNTVSNVTEILKNTNIDFKVNEETGECFISQRKTAELLGVALSTLQLFIGTLQTDTAQGLTPEILNLSAQHFAKKGRTSAIDILGKLAGAKAFIYSGAGMEINAQPKTPVSFSEALLLVGKLQAEKEALEVQAKLDAPKVVFADLVRSEAESVEIGNYAKLLSKQYGVTVGPNKLREFLRKRKYLMEGRDNFEKNRPYQKWINLPEMG